MALTCDHLLVYLSDYIDDNLDDELTQAAQEHLATCQNCRVVLSTTQKTIVLLSEHEKRVIPAERRKPLFDRLTDAFENR